MPAGDLKAALWMVWIVVSVVALSTLLAPWILTPQQIAAATPRCEWKERYGKECMLCGMTTAFLSIRQGRFEEAERANRGALPLYAGFVLNEAVLVLFWKRKACSA